MERIYYRDQVLETIARKVLCAYDTILFYGDPQLSQTACSVVK